MTTSKAALDAAYNHGLRNVTIAGKAADKVGLPFYAACALLEKESGGLNIYGNDAGGALSGFKGTVDASNFAVFRWLVFTKGMTSNGVGPCQLTYKGFFTDMDSKGLKPWDLMDNMLYGFKLLNDYHKSTGSWAAAGTKYNGAAAYGVDLAAKVVKWKGILGNL